MFTKLLLLKILGVVTIFMYLYFIFGTLYIEHFVGEKESEEIIVKYLYADEWEHSRGETVFTREYQIKLNSTQWKNRKNQLNFVVKTINEYADGLFYISQNKGEENVREQIYIDKTSNCGHKETIRIRNYLWGFQKNKSTIDNKYVSQEGLDLLHPINLFAPKKLNKTSIMKIEQDVHPCKDDKWSKELRLTDVPFQPYFNFCKEIKEYFPYLWIDFDEFGDNTVKMRKPEFWWQFSNHGFLIDGTKWKSAFTLKYSSYDDAVHGITEPLPRGEWSIRIYATDEGRGAWDYEIVDLFDHFYLDMLGEFGSDNEWPCN